MRTVPVRHDGNVIVGIDAKDDAGVYRVSEPGALVQTVDFITPIVDDPFLFGRIAACNSLSDVYAMGGRPITALNIVCFPVKKFTMDVLGEVLRGGLSMIEEAGVQLLGGHSVEDPEFKYGLSVTGLVDPERVVRNNTPHAGDALVLTKPLGTGLLATALKAGPLDDGIAGPFLRSMTSLNRAASEIMLLHGVHACTDVTGFGLIGHAKEMLGDGMFEITIDSKSVPVLAGAADAARGGLIPAGMYRNRDFVGPLCRMASSVSQERCDILFDPQTSGGLLIAAAALDAAGIVKQLHSLGITDAAVIGRIGASRARGITVE